MADPYVFGGSSFPYDGMTFQSQPYCGLEDGLADSNMTYIDPTLQSPSPNHYDNAWATPAQLKETSTSALFLPDLCRQVPDHTSIRPALGIAPVPPPSQIRLASPISSIESPSSGNAHSPHADTESYYDNIPRTPPDTTLLSPFQPPLSLEPFAHAVQFSGMGPGYVNPFDVNPSQPSEYCESDNGIVDFNFAKPNYSFDMHGSCEMEPTQSAAVSGFTARRASPDQMRPMAKGSMDVSSQYPPPPNDEDMGSDDEASGKRQNDDDADGDYRPNKRQRTVARTPRRGMKTVTTPLSASPRRTRTRATNIPPARSFTTSSSNTNSKTSLACPTCKQRNFPSQPDLDAHIKKQHLRSFNCVFDFAGCDSTFGSKNEWKRHVSTQHLLLHYWVCTEGTCAAAHTTSPSPSSPATPNANANPNGAIFNRKDLFTQHLKRMHAPKAVKDHLPSPKHRTTTTTPKSTPNPTTTNLVITQWESHLKRLQEDAIRPRCALPTLMRCPVPSCRRAEPFRGQDAWNQRMEHVAKHMERAAQGKEARVVFGGEADDTLVGWAGRGDVAIIVPRGEGDGWGLKSPLRRGPGGNVVVVAPVKNNNGGGDGGREGEEIVVGDGGGGDGEEEEDAEGEED